MVVWKQMEKVVLFILSFLFFCFFFLDFMPRHYGYNPFEVQDGAIRQKLSVAQFNKTSTVFIPKMKRYRESRTEKERQTSIINLGRMDLIVAANNHPLPGRQIKGRAFDMCEGPKSENICVPKFIRMETRLKIVPKYKIMTCTIQKSMSTVMTAILCFLYDEQAFLNAGRELAKECMQVRFCQNKNEMASVANLRIKYGISDENMQKKWKFTMISRDPVDRFLSGFVDKCIRRCDLDRFFDKYSFIRYSSDPSKSLMKDLIPLLREQHVPESSISLITSQLTQNRTVHSTVQSDARIFLENRLRSSPFLMEYLIRMFYYDFKLFNYQFPEGF